MVAEPERFSELKICPRSGVMVSNSMAMRVETFERATGTVVLEGTGEPIEGLGVVRRHAPGAHRIRRHQPVDRPTGMVEDVQLTFVVLRQRAHSEIRRTDLRLLG